jgi:hypothetical protein
MNEGDENTLANSTEDKGFVKPVEEEIVQPDEVEDKNTDSPKPQEVINNKGQNNNQSTNQSVTNENSTIDTQIPIGRAGTVTIFPPKEDKEEFKDPTKPFDLDTNNILELDGPTLDECCRELEKERILIINSFDAEVLSAFPHTLIEKRKLITSDKRILFFKGDNLIRKDLSIETLVDEKIGRGDQTLIITEIFDNGAQYLIDSLLRIDAPNYINRIKKSLKTKGRMILLLIERKLFIKTFKEKEKNFAFPPKYIDFWPHVLKIYHYSDCEIKRIQNEINQQRSQGLWENSDVEFYDQVIKYLKNHELNVQVESRKGKIKPSELLERKPFKTLMIKTISTFVDGDNRLWVTDGEQVKIFHVNSTNSIDGWPLMGKRWKKIFHQPWCNSLLCADWEGSLYIFNEKTRGEGQVLRKAKYNDLPVHCIAGEKIGQLAVGTWDGKILIYDSGESTNLEPHNLTIPYLPIHLDILAPGSIAVADQSGDVRLIDFQGTQKVIWKSDAAIKDMWAYEEKPGYFVLLILEKNRLVEVKIPGDKTQVIPLDGEVVSLSHRKRNAQDKWTAVVMKGGVIDWLSWKPLRILNNNRVKLNFEIRQFIALYDPQQPIALIGIGLNEEGKFFFLNGGDLKIYSGQSIERLLVDKDGRFVFWLFKNNIEWRRNPAILSIACRVEKVATDGYLISGKYKEIKVTLKNSGTVPIFKIRTQLKGHERIVEEKTEEKKIRLFPDQTMDLSFSVKAIAVGTLNLEFQLEMEDEAGPPGWKQTIGLRVESKEK